MGDANVRRPVATRFEHGVDFGLLVHKSPFMADDRDPLVLSNYIFELLEVNPGVAGFLIQLHPDDVDAVVESVTAHAEKGAGTKTTLYVGQEEEEVEEVEEEEEDAGGVGAGGRKEKPHNPLMISVQKVRIRPGKGKGQSDGWFPQPLTHNTRRVCTDDPENKLPMHSLCPTREWEREWYGVTTPNIVSGQGVILFPFGATPPLIGEAEEVVAAEPLGAFNRDPNDLVLTVGVSRVFFGPLLQNPPSFRAQVLLFFMDNAVNEALRGLNTANLRRYTDLQCPKARRRRLKAVQRLVRVLLGDPDVVCGTNTKGEVCLSGGACTALSGPLGGHLALTAQEHEALSMLRMACSMHLSQRALLRMPRRCTQRDLRTVRQRIMPYFPQTTIVKSTTGRNRAAAHVPLQSIVQNAISMARVIGKPPPSGVAIIVISVDATSLWKASSTRADVWVNVWGGAKYASKVKLWASWFCMDGGDEQAFLRSLDISANLNQEVRDVEEDVVLFQNQFLTCTVILTGDGKGMQAMGGAGSKCWLCKDPNGIVEQMGVESTSRWGSFLRSVTPDRRPGDYQHAACRILNGIAKRIETTLQALPPSTPGKAQALAALQAFKQALKDETAGIPLRERLPSASRATEKDFDLTSTKVFLTSPPFQRQFVECLKEHVPTVRTPGGPMLWVVVHVMVKCIEGLYELWRVRELYTLTQVERHRALTTKFSKAWGDSGWSPTRWIHWCLAHSTFFAEKWRNIFQFSSIPTEYRHGPYKRRLKNCFKGWSLVRPSMSLRHMHHCMSMNALEQGLLGLEAAKASDIDDFV